jgi:hypothetical protein
LLLGIFFGLIFHRKAGVEHCFCQEFPTPFAGEAPNISMADILPTAPPVSSPSERQACGKVGVFAQAWWEDLWEDHETGISPTRIMF